MIINEYINEINHAQANPGYCNEFTEDVCLKAFDDDTVSEVNILMIFDERSPFHDVYDSPYAIDERSINTFESYPITTPENGRWRDSEYVYHVVPLIDGYVLEPQLSNAPEDCLYPLDEYQDMFEYNNSNILSFYITEFEHDKF